MEGPYTSALSMPRAGSDSSHLVIHSVRRARSDLVRALSRQLLPSPRRGARWQPPNVRPESTLTRQKLRSMPVSRHTSIRDRRARDVPSSSSARATRASPTGPVAVSHGGAFAAYGTASGLCVVDLGWPWRPCRTLPLGEAGPTVALEWGLRRERRPRRRRRRARRARPLRPGGRVERVRAARVAPRRGAGGRGFGGGGVRRRARVERLRPTGAPLAHLARRHRALRLPRRRRAGARRRAAAAAGRRRRRRAAGRRGGRARTSSRRPHLAAAAEAAAAAAAAAARWRCGTCGGRARAAPLPPARRRGGGRARVPRARRRRRRAPQRRPRRIAPRVAPARRRRRRFRRRRRRRRQRAARRP